MIARALPALIFIALGAGCGLINALSSETIGSGDGGGAACGVDGCFCDGPGCTCNDVEQLCQCLGDCSVSSDRGPACSGTCVCSADACFCTDVDCTVSFGNDTCDGPSCSCTTEGCVSEG